MVDLFALMADYQHTLAGYREQVTGRPEDLASLAASIADISGRVSQVGTGLQTSRSTLARGWSGAAFDAFAKAEAGHRAGLDEVAGKLRKHEAALQDAATAVTVAMRRMDDILSWFQDQAPRILEWARTLPPETADAAVSRMRQTGEQAVGSARSVTATLSEDLREATSRMT